MGRSMVATMAAVVPPATPPMIAPLTSNMAPTSAEAVPNHYADNDGQQDARPQVHGSLPDRRGESAPRLSSTSRKTRKM